MREVKSIRIFMRINAFIFRKATGTPEQFAKTMEMCRSNLLRYIKAMRNAGAPIKYCRIRQTYYYNRKGNFIFGFIEG